MKRFAAEYDDNGWKENKYWSEELDELYSKYIKLLEYIFSNYSGLRTKPGKQAFMALEEFRNFVVEFELDNILPSSEIPLCYNLAMMTQADEIDSERSAEMSFVEFMEAFAHIADLSASDELGVNSLVISSNSKDIPLCIKVETLLKRVSNHIRIPKRVVEGYKLPNQSLFDSKGNLKEDD